ncbi:uncharacterized protein LOC132296099 [Cornus florida]|uniref:uncharacterized protein LOC132296099 n=1 Tax=Cornus florida TaxID=4283 RepID=UPI0028A2CB81|nr:uncharacterized protein LOC132296099 [Cornus florida]
MLLTRGRQARSPPHSHGREQGAKQKGPSGYKRDRQEREQRKLEMAACIGAIDGTHIDAVIPVDQQLAYRGRKGDCTQNVIAACSFDMKFTFVWAGWEGSAHDSRILNEALGRPNLNFPKPPSGKYYVVDAGYANMPGYLAPYKGARWAILKHMAPFPFPTQRLIVIASMALHNYIRQEAIADAEFRRYDDDEGYASDNDDMYTRVTLSESSGTVDQQQEMSIIRDGIANSIWQSTR